MAATTPGNGMMEKALVRLAKQQFDEYAELSARLSPDVLMSVMAEKKAGALSDYIATNITIPFEKKQQLLEECHPTARLRLLVAMLREECGPAEQSSRKSSKRYKIRWKTTSGTTSCASSSRPFGASWARGITRRRKPSNPRKNRSPPVEERRAGEAAQRSRPAVQNAGWFARSHCGAGLSRHLSGNAAGENDTSDKHDIAKAAAILDREHYGLQKVKARILEALAVYGLSGSVNAQTLCLVGPPGVGKNLDGPIHRQVYGAQIRPGVLGRRSG